jgi:hypothetical protein
MSGKTTWYGVGDPPARASVISSVASVTLAGDSIVMVRAAARVKVGAGVGVAVGREVEVGAGVSVVVGLAVGRDVPVGVERFKPLDSRVIAIAVGQ